MAAVEEEVVSAVETDTVHSRHEGEGDHTVSHYMYASTGSEPVKQLQGDGLLLGQDVVTGSVLESTGAEALATGGPEATTTTTIIYIQPDCTFIEGSGFTIQEQQLLVEHLSKPLGQPGQEEAPVPAPTAALSPKALQQVVDEVSKLHKCTSSNNGTPSHSVAPQEPSTTVSTQSASQTASKAVVPPQPVTVMTNASQQLQNVAKQVALQQSQSQNGTSTKKMEGTQFQIHVPSVQEVKEPSPSCLGVFQQNNVYLNQLPVSVSTDGNITCPQFIHIAPLANEKRYFLQNPGDPPIQLLLHTSEPLVESHVPVLQKVPPQTPINGKAVVPAAASSTNTALQKNEKQHKKPQKIKTRSGRVSRPPKYKVKDYKFIKREDLADGHQSDSDDYSEISIEEEQEEGEAKMTISDFTINPKTYKCETCEKAYIGNGGLSRHYRLKPSHRVYDTAEETVMEISQHLKEKKTGSSEGAISVTQRLNGADAQSGAVAVDKNHGSTSELPCSLRDISTVPGTSQGDEKKTISGHIHGFDQPKGPGRPRHPKMTSRTARRGRPGRPSKHYTDLTMDQQKATLKEVLQQCNPEELIEIALPRVAEVVTVWEFLLMKVKMLHPSEPHFPEVCGELEQLQTKVKKMAEDYLGTDKPCAPLTMDIWDPQELRSLPAAKRARIEPGAGDGEDVPRSPASALTQSGVPSDTLTGNETGIEASLQESYLESDVVKSSHVSDTEAESESQSVHTAPAEMEVSSSAAAGTAHIHCASEQPCATLSCSTSAPDGMGEAAEQMVTTDVIPQDYSCRTTVEEPTGASHEPEECSVSLKAPVEVQPADTSIIHTEEELSVHPLTGPQHSLLALSNDMPMEMDIETARQTQ